MNFESAIPALFLERPNRFVARVELDGRPVECHVKNTGRLRELLTPGAEVLLSVAANALRKTRYDLICVYHQGRLVSIDSQAPNRLFAEWLRAGGLFEKLTLLRPECRYAGSRLDFYLEGDGRRAFAEVKGVTLVREGVARFPDAPTERGVRHLHALMEARKNGYDALAAFIIQRKGVCCLEPNDETHPAFGDALRQAVACGVRVVALDCQVTPAGIWVDQAVPVRL